MKILLCLPFFILLAFTGFAQSEPVDTAIYTKVEEMPSYAQGDEALLKYLAFNTVYPKKAKEDNVSGVVYVSFVIEKDGSVNLVKIFRSPHDLLSEEAIRVIASMPNWNPGKHNGEEKRVKSIIPIRFNL